MWDMPWKIGLVSKEEIKRVKSFRLSPRCVQLVHEGAAATGLSEGDLVERCIEAQLRGVVENSQRERAARANALAAILPRERAPYSPRGTVKPPTKEGAAPAGLKKTQRN
jgi:hypothetical protein